MFLNTLDSHQMMVFRMTFRNGSGLEVDCLINILAFYSVYSSRFICQEHEYIHMFQSNDHNGVLYREILYFAPVSL